MAEEDAAPLDESQVTEEQAPEPEGTTEETPEEPDDWKGEFDPERAKKTIGKLREELRAAKSDKAPQSEKDEKAISSLRKQLADLEGKAKAVDEKDQQISAQEATILRYEVAFDLGLPKELASRLRGNDRDEMLQDAQALLELVSAGKRPPTKRPAESLRGGGEPEREPEETDLSKLGARMFRR